MLNYMETMLKIKNDSRKKQEVFHYQAMHFSNCPHMFYYLDIFNTVQLAFHGNLPQKRFTLISCNKSEKMYYFFVIFNHMLITYYFILLAGPIPLRVREAEIPIVSDAECIRKINAVTEKIFILPASSFCAGGEEGNDACQVQYVFSYIN